MALLSSSGVKQLGFYHVCDVGRRVFVDTPFIRFAACIFFLSSVFTMDIYR